MTSPTNDPWADYRKQNGEFRQWLHLFQRDPTAMASTFNTGALPWVTKAVLGGEMLKAMHNIGMTARWPGEWSRFNPDYLERTGPTYGVLLPVYDSGALSKHISVLLRQQGSVEDLFSLLDRRYVLFPKRRV